jgi:hypothetical protein
MLSGETFRYSGIYFLLGIVLACGVSAACGAAETPRKADQINAAITLQGAWQFHLGDDPQWAQPKTPDSAGMDGWEQIDPETPWGAQGHPSYAGYAWYRKHIHLASTPGASPDVALLIQHVDDAYEVYWNGTLIGRSGTSPRTLSITPTTPKLSALGRPETEFSPCASGRLRSDQRIQVSAVDSISRQ